MGQFFLVLQTDRGAGTMTPVAWDAILPARTPNLGNDQLTFTAIAFQMGGFARRYAESVAPQMMVPHNVRVS